MTNPGQASSTAVRYLSIPSFFHICLLTTRVSLLQSASKEGVIEEEFLNSIGVVASGFAMYLKTRLVDTFSLLILSAS